MKKNLLIAALAVLGANLSAQELRFGPKAGYSLSTLKFKSSGESESTDPLHTFYVGGMVEYKISDKFGLQGEVLYSQLGGKVSKSVEDEDNELIKVQNKMTFGTLLVPVSAKYFITEGLSVSAGASFGYILTAKSKTVTDLNFGGLIPGLELGADDETDIKDQTNTLNIAPFLGAEYALENGLFFDARYNMGVSNLAKNPVNGEKTTNSFLQVGIGFKFGGN
ncbi:MULTISPECIES: porin family protein [unclassified Chryseobacterium]|uniref:porin family protein n=1 Tax=unclassified Chryseobacterium TaxID=2593645 RepID=UPI00068A32FF|nr:MULTISPECIES: porin family protein [unclassified Chryseobacterium]SHG04485.1 Outer membrane protein beta-barrel domain-containing protein [Chryseobacterium sp. OV279]HCA09803.1 PorT family protein [Chryseobacterium sp.]